MRVRVVVLGAILFVLWPTVFAADVSGKSTTDRPIPISTLIFRELEGLRGGYKLYLHGDGTGMCQKIYRSDTPGHPMMEKRYRLALPQSAIQSLNALIHARSFTNIAIPARAGIPGETRPAITVTLASGKTATISKWANDRHSDFDLLYRACLDIVETCASGSPFHEGQYDSAWVPSGF